MSNSNRNLVRPDLCNGATPKGQSTGKINVLLYMSLLHTLSFPFYTGTPYAVCVYDRTLSQIYEMYELG